MNGHNEEEINGLISDYHPTDNEVQLEESLEQPSPPIKSSFCFSISLVFYVLMILLITLWAVLLVLKLDGDIQWTFSNVMIFFHFGFITLLILMNIVIFKNARLFGNFLGKCFLTFCLNSVILMIICFGMLLTLKLGGEIAWTYAVVFLPFYFIMGIAFMFICFIMPGLVDSEVKMYSEAVVISSQYFSILLTVILILFKLDKSLKLSFFEIFILEEIMLLVLTTLQALRLKKNDVSLFSEIENLLLIVSSLFGFIILGLKCDGIIQEKWEFILIPFVIVYLGVVLKSFRMFRFFYQLNRS